MKGIGLLALLFLSSACSYLGQKQPNPELYNTLVLVSANYLKHVVNADEPKISNVILWEDFLESNHLTKDQYRFKLQKLRAEVPSIQAHPLLGLEIVDVDWSEDLASVRFRKTADTNSPVITIELYWGSNSWLVLDDNLFGPNELLDRWLKITS